ncbi:MAG TPA: 16S rRNA (cytosine(967)-C(5))-methyltransferase RsmB [Myxococcota bacterium]|nr:16S rRNA (cytosine(967)-C(5))-methyltransferase RsmB [Myxococcota bacterium]
MTVKPTGRAPGPRRGPPRRAGADLHAHAPTRARLLALRVLERVQRAGAYADVLLHSQLARSGLGPVDRAFATELVYGTLRWRGRIDYLLGRFLDRPLDRVEGIAATALRLGAYQILFNDRVPTIAAVDEAVRCARAAGAERVTGLVNAVLRRLAEHHASEPMPALDSDPLGHLMHAQSLPAWVAARWLELYGPSEAAALAAASTETPPLTVRANPHRGEVAELLDELHPLFPDARPCRYARYGAVLGRRGNATAMPSFLAGRFTVQDEASQLVVGLLDPQPGERALDTCAAPGGKATAIAERVGRNGSVLALDRHPGRLDLVRRAARRLQLGRLECRAFDATLDLAELAAGVPFDRVLVDAPCSGLGSLRRNPDARWRVRPTDPARLAEVQRALLTRASRVVVRGGVLVYSTCTLLPEENEAVVESFLRESPQFAPMSPREAPEEVRELVDERGYLRCWPHRHDTDGFFAARLERRPSG